MLINYENKYVGKATLEYILNPLSNDINASIILKQKYENKTT